MSKIWWSIFQLKTTTVDLREIVGDVLQSIHALAIENRVEVDLSLADAPLLVLGDPARLQQIQANLLANAIKYSSAGQRVRMSIPAPSSTTRITAAMVDEQPVGAVVTFLDINERKDSRKALSMGQFSSRLGDPSGCV